MYLVILEDANGYPGTGASRSWVYTLATQTDGKVLVGGVFTSINNIPRKRIARLNADGSVDTSFYPGTGANGIVLTLAVQSDSKVLVGGVSTIINGTALSLFIARLNTYGSVDTSFDPDSGTYSNVEAMAVQSDGKVLVGGYFASINDIARNRIARLNADGSVDTGFNPGTGANGNVRALAVQADGKVLVGGNFTRINDIARNRIARLNTDGSVDTSFDPGTGANWGGVSTLAVQVDGKVLLGGEFASINGIARNRIARLNADGSVDTSFDPGIGANHWVYTMAVQADGKVLVAGRFTQINGITHNYIARLNTDGTVDTSFDPGTGANHWVYTLSVQADGKVLIGGEFTHINGIERNRIARLNTDGSVDTSFNPPVEPPVEENDILLMVIPAIIGALH